MRIDVIVEPHLQASEVARLGVLAESLGIAGVWVPNNIASRDPFVNFVPLAQQTTRLRMGPIAVSPFEVHPQRLANSLLTLNEIAHGRAQIVVGGGGGTLEAMGMKPQRMVRAVRECVGMLRLAISGQPGGYRGEVFRTGWLDASWASAPPPALYVGANGPQMLRMAARCADGIMMSDVTPDRVRAARREIDPLIAARGLDPGAFPLTNFWAWHVKESRELAEREARIFLAVRGTIYEPYIHDFATADEAALVAGRLGAFLTAYQRKSPEIDGVPEALLGKFIAGGVSASSEADIGHEIDRLRSFAAAGLTGIALCLYADPEYSIRLIGERVVPALAGVGPGAPV